jgi:hypothetical protein
MKKYYTLYTLEMQSLITLTVCLTVVILLTAVLSGAALTVVNLNLFLILAKAVSVLPAVTCTIRNVLSIYLASFFLASIDIVFLPSLKSFVASF